MYLAGGVYQYNATLPAGIFSWYSIANDTQGNFNISIERLATITRASNPVVLSINGNSNQNVSAFYGVSNSVSGSASSGDVILSRDGVLLFNPDISILGVNLLGYRYNASVFESQNYTSNSSSFYLFVSPAVPTLSLYLNGTQENLSIIYGPLSNITAFENNSGDDDLIYTLYRNGQIISVGSLVSDLQTFAAGNYLYVYNTTGGQNYSNASLQFALTVNKSAPNLGLLINGVDSDSSITAGSLGVVNASAITPEGFSVDLFLNGVSVSSGISISDVRNYTSPGEFNWTVSIGASENYTSGSKGHFISVIDASAPQFSNIRESPEDSADYSSGQRYEFNITWTDNIAISDVIFEFNSVNHSLSSGSVIRQGDDYSYSLTDLPAGTYSYRWYANDSSGTWTRATPQTYTIDRSIAALFLLFTPGSNILYSQPMSVVCSPNNPESVTGLFRAGVAVSNPDESILAVGNYLYSCVASSTQNYTSTFITGKLIVAKASPSISLLLNNQSANISLPVGGGQVNVSASLTSPNAGNITILSNGAEVASGQSPLATSLILTGPGEYSIVAQYSGSENYTSGSLARLVSVDFPTSLTTPGPGGGGGGGGGASSDSTRLEILHSTNPILKVGEQGTIEISIRNTGTKFLNNCKIILSDEPFSSWISSSESLSFASGEKVDFNLEFNIPRGSNSGEYTGDLDVACDEILIHDKLIINVINPDIELEIVNYSRESIDKLRIDYTLQYFTGIGDSAEVRYVLNNLGGVTLSEGSEIVVLPNSEIQSRSLIIDLPKDSFGEFSLKFSARTLDAYLEFDRDIVLSSQGLTGLAISDSNARTLKSFVYWIIGFAIVFILFRYVLVHYRRNQPPHKNSSLILENYHPPEPSKGGIWKAVFNLKYW